MSAIFGCYGRIDESAKFFVKEIGKESTNRCNDYPPRIIYHNDYAFGIIQDDSEVIDNERVIFKCEDVELVGDWYVEYETAFRLCNQLQACQNIGDVQRVLEGMQKELISFAIAFRIRNGSVYLARSNRPLFFMHEPDGDFNVFFAQSRHFLEKKLGDERATEVGQWKLLELNSMMEVDISPIRNRKALVLLEGDRQEAILIADMMKNGFEVQLVYFEGELQQWSDILCKIFGLHEGLFYDTFNLDILVLVHNVYQIAIRKNYSHIAFAFNRSSGFDAEILEHTKRACELVSPVSILWHTPFIGMRDEQVDEYGSALKVKELDYIYGNPEITLGDVL